MKEINITVNYQETENLVHAFNALLYHVRRELYSRESMSPSSLKVKKYNYNYFIKEVKED